jgi:hypothetical protein
LASKPKVDQRVVRILAITGLASLALLVLLLWLNVQPNSLGFEIAKALLQLVFVGVVGGLLALGTFDYQQYREGRNELQLQSDQLLRSLLDDALSGYHDVKRARRLMQACLHAAGGIRPFGIDLYDEQLEVINGTQLSFERLALLVNSMSDPRVVPSMLKSRMKAIEHSLHRLVDEYERERPRMSAQSPLVGIDELPELRWFLDRESSRTFNDSIGDPFQALVQQLQDAVLKPIPPGRSYASVDSRSRLVARRSRTRIIRRRIDGGGLRTRAIRRRIDFLIRLARWSRPKSAAISPRRRPLRELRRSPASFRPGDHGARSPHCDVPVRASPSRRRRLPPRSTQCRQGLSRG